MRLLSTSLVGPSISVPVLVLLTPYHARAIPNGSFPPLMIRVRLRHAQPSFLTIHRLSTANPSADLPPGQLPLYVIPTLLQMISASQQGVPYPQAAR